jgi:class 3 adenylate cyclase
VACAPGRILLSQPTWLLVQDVVRCVAKGEIEVKGIHHAVPVYEVDEPLPSTRTTMGAARDVSPTPRAASRAPGS